MPGVLTSYVACNSLCDAMTLAEWLRSAREAQVNPATGKPWSQAYAAQRITEATGKTLYREALNGYENGKGMEPETYDRIVAFWRPLYTVAPPALNAKNGPPLSLEERAVLAAEALVEATREQNQLLRGLLLRALSPDAETERRMRPGLDEFLAAIPMQSQHPTPDLPATPGR